MLSTPRETNNGPSTQWHSMFEGFKEKTLIQTVVTYQSLADLETVIHMGMQEGFSLALDQLEVLLT